MKLTLPNGITVEGKDEVELSKVCTALGYGYLAPARDSAIWHYSRTKSSWTKITEMDTKWLKNSVLKLNREWLEEVEKAASPREMVMMIIRHEDTHQAALLRELNRRSSW